MLKVQMLGAFSIKSGKKSVALTSRAAQSLFAYLMLNAGASHRREKLAGQLWPDSREEAARDYLRHAIWRIRKALVAVSAADLLKADDLSVAFVPSDDCALDTAAVSHAGECKSPDELMQALSAYGGELLPGFYEDWVVLEREHLRAIYEQEMDRLLAMLEQEGRWQQVLEWAEKWISLGQRPEPAYRALMLAHAENGDISKVAASYERCVKTLDEFGVEPSEQTRTLFEEIKSGRHVVAPAKPQAAPKPKAAPASNIPVPLTSFVGRQRELKKISELLAASRLLTLTGPGGVGKTRLAIRAAAEATKGYRDGVCWVDLAALADPNLLPQEIAQALRVREAAAAPLVETLIAHLKSRQLLLVLDNCEHLIEACARIAEELLGACPNVRVLATSIEGLGLFNETVWQVPSLPLAPSPSSTPLQELRQVESIRLFDERAAHASASFAMDEGNAADVAQICQRLEGIPLAIELAAARIKVLSVQEIAARLDDRFSLLTAGSRTAIPRHQTLRATIDWSHDLLSEPERMLFRRLSVFAGGFTLEAAEAVCSSGMPAGEILDLLGRLAAKSLVVVEAPEEGETRYRLLETIRQYALEKLVTAGEVPETRGRHVDYYLAMAEESEMSLHGHHSRIWFRRLHRDVDNLRFATDWATTAGRADAALRILAATVYFWFAQGLPGSEWHERIQQALDRPQGRSRTLARAKALNAIGFMYWADVYPVDKRAELEEALAIGTETADRPTVATALSNLALLSLMQENYPAAREHLERSLKIWEEIGPRGRMGKAITQIFLGDGALRAGDAGTARQLFEASAAALQELGDPNFQAYSIRRLGHIAWRAGDVATATACCKQSLEMNLEVDDPRGICACLAAFVAIALGTGQPRIAAVLAAAVENQLARLRIPLLYVDRLEFEENLGRLRKELQPKAFAKAWAEGRELTTQGAISLALEMTG